MRAGVVVPDAVRPMLFVVYNGFDLVAVALAVGGAALVRRRHPEAGGVAFVVGTFTKVWPVVLSCRPARAASARSSLRSGRRSSVSVAPGAGPGGRDRAGADVSAARLGVRERAGIGAAALHPACPAVRVGSWRLGAAGDLRASCSSALHWSVRSPSAWWFRLAAAQAARRLVAETAAITALLVFGTLLSPQFSNLGRCRSWRSPRPGNSEAAGGVGGAVPVLTLLDWISSTRTTGGSCAVSS